MIDPELKSELHAIQSALRNSNPWWKSLLHGLLGGFGYVIGFLVALAALGFLLNIIGIIPAFRREVDNWRTLLQQTQQKQPLSLPTNQNNK